MDNLNLYLTEMKIKQSFISLKTGMNESKVSRILKGTQEITISDMEMISAALGQKVDFFYEENFKLPIQQEYTGAEVAFYVGEPTLEQQVFAGKIVSMAECMDEILGAEVRMYMAIKR